ncbi:archaeosortase/exosortase family protein [Qipengyuania sp. CAU 1752]
MISRAPAYAVALVLLILNADPLPILSAWGTSWSEMTFSLFGINAIVWLALATILVLATRAKNDDRLRPVDWLFLTGAAIACLLPIGAPAAVVLLGIAVWLLWDSPRKDAVWGMGLIALAVTGRVFWSKVGLALFGGLITSAEAYVIPALTGVPTSGNVFSANDGTMNFVVIGGCSSLANLSLVAILAVAVTQLFDLRFGREMWIAVALGAIATIAINAVRLGSYAYRPDLYDYLHVGTGAVLFGHATFLAIGAIVLWGAHRAIPAAR